MKLINTFLNRLSILLFLSVLWISCDDTEEPSVSFPTAYDLEAEAPFYFGSNFEIPEDNPMTVEGIALGRMLFYEKKLSGDNTMSCGSCHLQSKAFTDGNQFSEGIDGIEGSFNTMSLANLLWNEKFFWDGRSSSLEEQALIPIEDPIEMHQSLDEAVAKLQNTTEYPEMFNKAFGDEIITAENIGKAIAQFERTLISSNSKYDAYLQGDYTPTSQELKGIDLFFTHPIAQIGLRGGNCGDCHTNILTSGDLNNFNGFHNNGLDDDNGLKSGLEAVTGNSADKGKFKAPTLRNIALTAPYMHDGRFNTLEEVLEHYDQHIRMSATLDPLIIEASNELRSPGDPVKLFMTDDEKEAILAFLNMLTDNEFITNTAFSDPFKN